MNPISKAKPLSMHDDSYVIMAHLVRIYLKPAHPLRVLDVGSQDINGSYRQLFAQPNWHYEGADMVAGPNVDIVFHDPYRWDIRTASYDLVISGQAFEHIEFFWLTWLEMVRTVRPDGMIFLVAPSTGREHRHPVDCWRFYRDGMRALAKYGGVELLAAETYWTNPWGDTVGVFRKPAKEGGARDLFKQPSDLALPRRLAAFRPSAALRGRRLRWRLKTGLRRCLAILQLRHQR